MSKTIIESPSDLYDLVGTTLGPSPSMEITQERINQFADATGDHQWIHIDAERAAKGPFGATIAHGYLTMSLAAKFMPEIIEVRGIAMGVNYGTEKNALPLPRDGRFKAVRNRDRGISRRIEWRYQNGAADCHASGRCREARLYCRCD